MQGFLGMGLRQSLISAPSRDTMDVDKNCCEHRKLGNIVLDYSCSHTALPKKLLSVRSVQLLKQSGTRSHNFPMSKCLVGLLFSYSSVLVENIGSGRRKETICSPPRSHIWAHWRESSPDDVRALLRTRLRRNNFSENLHLRFIRVLYCEVVHF